jgi:hypothetical protein
MVALVEAMDVFPIKSLVSNLHPSTEGSNCRKILNREPDRLGGRRKTTTYESRTRSTLALCHEQFGWQSVVEGHHLLSRLSFLLSGVAFAKGRSDQKHRAFGRGRLISRIAGSPSKGGLRL